MNSYLDSLSFFCLGGGRYILDLNCSCRCWCDDGWASDLLLDFLRLLLLVSSSGRWLLVIFRNADAIRCRGLLRFDLSGLALTGLLAGALAAEEVGIGGAIEVDTDAAGSQLLVLGCFHFLISIAFVL